ncbi:carbohydrate-binding protein [Natrinema halophilum]|uniref:carbohydrate-binding protein n=1 Tax=Natrinema halophilum TaxID=1699371 RepID=UPI001F379F6B|nr:carbohydrate-binding protein [Natrinema halophilum]QLG47769.2 carbohydrate-binding protein [Natrinema halophilum]
MTTATAAAGTGVFSASGAATAFEGARHVIPGRIEAEDYDTDGSFWAYRDASTGNSGGAYRSDGVDIEEGGDNYNVGWTEAGEWLNYSATVESTGTYEVTAHVVSGGGGGTITLLRDQRSLTTFDIPDTGSWQSWTTVTREVNLDSGECMIAIHFDTGGTNIDWLEFSQVDGGRENADEGNTGDEDADEQSAYADHSFPGRIEAEEYDTGGQGVAYNDTTSGNAGGAYRSDGVDIEGGGDNYNIGWTEAGEWYEYTVDVTEGTYDLTANVASNAGGGAFRVEVDGTDVTGTITAPNTGGWQSWTRVTASDVSLSSGRQVVRIYVEDGGFNFDWIEAETGGDQPPEDGDGADNYPNLDGNSWQLVWNDEFDGRSIDSSKWSFATGGGCGQNGRLNTDCSWGNQEEQYYTNGDNAWVEGDRLIIEAREEAAPNGQNSYTSARLVSENKFEKQFGRVEVRARLPATQALWPAIWMLGQDIDSVSWPDCGEIDIMELTGDDTDTVHQTIHGPGYSGGGGISANYDINGDFSQEFHDFQLTWYDDLLKFWVDGNHVNTLTPSDVGGNEWVFNDQFFLLLNVAVGGLMPGYPDGRTQLPQRMEVEYVRVYDPV